MILPIPIEDLDAVPVFYLCRAFHESGIDAAEGANNMGWFHSKNDIPDSSRFLRTIGLRPMRESKDGEPSIYRKTVKYEQAVKLCEAMHYDPIDLGL